MIEIFKQYYFENTLKVIYFFVKKLSYFSYVITEWKFYNETYSINLLYIYMYN